MRLNVAVQEGSAVNKLPPMNKMKTTGIEKVVTPERQLLNDQLLNNKQEKERSCIRKAEKPQKP